jgi:hypothetical protein
VPAFQPLLADLDLTDVVVTTDALHTHPGAAEFLVTGKQAHHLLVVKANQPTLLDAVPRRAGQPRDRHAAPTWPGITSLCWTAPAIHADPGDPREHPLGCSRQHP